MADSDDGVPRAMRAEEAGRVLATLLGLPAPIPPAKMWRLARHGLIKTVCVGRLRFFQSTTLQRFVAEGGKGFERRGQ
jgi:hypothetical protein